MNINQTSNTLTPEQRQQMWDDAERDESTLINPQVAASEKPKIEHTPTDTPAHQDAVQKTATDDAAGDQGKTDLSGIPREFLDTMAGLQETVEQLKTRLRGAEGHIGGIKSALKSAKDAAAASREAGHDAPTDAQIQAAQAGGSRAMAALKEKYPEFAVDLEAVLAEERAALRSDAQPAQTSGTQEQRESFSADDIAKAKRDAYIEAHHAGWEGLIGTPQFVGWYRRQAADVQALGQDPDPAAGVRLIDAYKREYGGGNQAAGNRLDAFEGLAAASNTRRGGFSSNKGIDQMTREEYWAHLEAQDKQKT